MVIQRGRGEKRPEAYPLGYVEDRFEPRTKLGAIFSSRYTFLRICPILFFFVRKYFTFAERG
jgi:hypothetical protein